MQHVGNAVRAHGQPANLFRSLFSWMQHVGPRMTWPWPAPMGFDPCSPGCSTSAFWTRAAHADTSPGFDPCSPGCSTSASTVQPFTACRAKFRSLFSWMQHVGYAPVIFRSGTTYVSILVLLDAARRPPHPVHPPCSTKVSILVLLDAARRLLSSHARDRRAHVSILVLLDAARRPRSRFLRIWNNVGFRSLFSWMQHVGCSTSATAALWDGERGVPVSILVLLDAARRQVAGSNPACPAAASFDPCSPGCSTSAALHGPDHAASHQVSILVLLDAARRQGRRSRTWSLRRQVSILVLLDAARRPASAS